MDMFKFSVWAEWAELIPKLGGLSSDIVCVPMWTLAVGVWGSVGLLVVIWAMQLRVKKLYSQLEQSTEDAGTLSELFSSELERVRLLLSQSREDSESLDEILESILKGGLPGFLEMTSKDYWCVKTMEVSYTDQEGKRQIFRQSGYHVNCFVPGGARDVEVTFGVVGGAPSLAVDRAKPDLPWVYEDNGEQKLEKFEYKRCPSHVKFEVQGPSLATFVAHVTEVHASESKGDEKDTEE